MARYPRKLAENVAYHVTARIHRREMIFENDDLKALFLDVVNSAKAKYDFSLRNFCIMGNHIHLDITPRAGASLSKIMQWILGVFASKFNKMYKHDGHVWYDRFKSKIIESFEQLVNTFSYIANNPVRANIVNHPLQYCYCLIA